MNISIIILGNVIALAIAISGIFVGAYCEHKWMLENGYRKTRGE